MLNVEDASESAIVAVGMERGMNEALVMRKEVQELVREMTLGKVAGLDGVQYNV